MPTFASRFDIYSETLAEADAQIDAFIDSTLDGVDAGDGTITEGEFHIQLHVEVTLGGNARDFVFKSRVVENTNLKVNMKSQVSGFFGGVDAVVNTYNSATLDRVKGKSKISVRYTE